MPSLSTPLCKILTTKMGMIGTSIADAISVKKLTKPKAIMFLLIFFIECYYRRLLLICQSSVLIARAWIKISAQILYLNAFLSAENDC